MVWAINDGNITPDMIRAPGYAFALAIIFAMAEASLMKTAAAPFPQTCDGPRSRKEMIESILVQVQQVIEKVEGVSPADTEYLRKEKRAALDADSPGRFNKLISHQSYYAFAARESGRSVVKALELAIDFENGRMTRADQIEQLAEALAEMGDLQEAMSDYIDADKVVLRRGDISSIGFLSAIAKGRLARAIGCFAQELERSSGAKVPQ